MEKKSVKEDILLWKKPKNVKIIEGFPGFGLVATIATGYLIEHLKCEQIGSLYFEETMPTLAIHKNKTIDPIGIYYSKQKNLIIIHAITNAAGIEWKAAEAVLNIAKQLNAKEIISLEGVGSSEKSDRGFHYTENQIASKKLKKIGIKELGEGIIVGVTSALMLRLKTEKIPMTCLFAEAHSQLPDSRAAAKIIEILDNYLGLKVDYKPLLKEAEEFEKKLKGIAADFGKAEKQQKKKSFGYIR